MSMNKFMHPRNIYRTPPDFKQLAIDFEEFRNVSKMSINGNVHIDFKNVTALRTLAQCLLKKDFNLNVTLPDTNLIPTLSLRLNYILWIEDVLQTLGLAENVIGIDIGCGASCIYPLLAVRQNPSWRMCGIDINDESIACARDNVTHNRLNDSIELIKASANDEPFNAFNRSERFKTADFTMCNPPFFSDDSYTSHGEPIEIDHKNRTGKRKQANNVKSGSGSELVTSGGEIAFVKQMIRNSRLFRDRIRVFTTMLGHKSSLTPIQNELKAQQICNFATSEFCQGRTMRWAIAWTFRRDLLLRLVPKCGQSTERKLLRYQFDANTEFAAASEKLFAILDKLDNSVVSRQRTESNRHELHFVAERNSWSKQRQKKRAAAMMQEKQDNDKSVPTAKRLKMDGDEGGVERADGAEGNEIPPHLHVIICIEKETFSDEESLEINLEFLNGSGGIDSTYQLLQFIKNKWTE